MSVFDPKQISTQDHLDIEDIRDNLVVLKNGKVSVVIETTSLNFDLLSGIEQDTSIGSFAGLLNSLNFPIQIVIRTQRTDISKYLTLLDQYKQTVANNNPLTQQISIYQEFINSLTASTQILNKRFYAVIPSTTTAAIKTPYVKQLLGQREKIINIQQVVEKAKVELQPKRDHLIKQFANMGLAAKQLTNEELIKLYYAIYEPDKLGVEMLNLREDSISGAVVSSEGGEVSQPEQGQSVKS